ncbi:MAG: hypothetical protein AAGK32_00275, partial [Actinomycetota bacterium]
MLDTTSTTVPGADSDLPDEASGDGGDDPEGPGSGAGTGGRSARLWWILGGLVALAIVIGVAVNLIEVDKVTIGPGDARPVENLVSIEPDGERFESEGDILFTTVRLDDTISLWEYLVASLDDDVEVFDAQEILGDRDPEESRQLNQDLMDDSKTTAIRVAFEHLGVDIASGTGAQVAGIDPDQEAAEVLASGETIVAIDEEPVELGDELVAEVRERDPGDEIVLTVEEDDGDQREETVELGERPDLDGEAYLGIGVGTRDLEIDLPFELDIDSGEVGGPSAGLAFTLAVLDLLTPGE